MIDSPRLSIMLNRVSPTAWVREGTTFMLAVTMNMNATMTRNDRVIAACELVNPRSVLPIRGRFTWPKSISLVILN
jgi:hypothetical protein